jgi:hypothetical protein
MVYDQDKMAAILKDVEDNFNQHLAKAEQEQKENELKKSEKTEEIKAEEKIEKKETVEEFDYDEEDFKEMNKMYSSMCKSEAEAHFNSLKTVLFGEEEIKKSEEKDEDLKKAEKLQEENELIKKENEELKKSLEKLISIVGKKIKKSAPDRKAIEKIQYINKSEMENKKEEKDVSKLKKSEITQILNNKNIDSIKHLL